MLVLWGHSMTTWTRRGARWSKKYLFLSTFRVKNVQVEVGGGQKKAKLCPRSHWMPPLQPILLTFGSEMGYRMWFPSKWVNIASTTFKMASCTKKNYSRLWNRRTPWNKRSPLPPHFHIRILMHFYINQGIAEIFHFFSYFFFNLKFRVRKCYMCLKNLQGPMESTPSAPLAGKLNQVKGRKKCHWQIHDYLKKK